MTPKGDARERTRAIGDTGGMATPREIAIREETIRLGQLLKLAGLADSGAEARELVQDGAARVNGQVETRRGRQLRRGDVVDVAGDAVRVA
jgi:ribosome-associated protein